jgi:hypothetical protein
MPTPPSDHIPLGGVVRFSVHRAGLPSLVPPRFNSACPNSPAADAREECWHVYYGDVHVGTIAIRTGIPFDEDLRLLSGQRAGRVIRTGPQPPSTMLAPISKPHGAYFRPSEPRGDYQAYRGARDWHARKYAMWEAGERLPSQKFSSLRICPCGEIFDSHRPEHTLIHVPHITAAHEADG